MNKPKFKIGDPVIHKGIVDELVQAWSFAVELGEVGSSLPKIFIVTHIYREECYGGCTQITYTVEHSDTVKRWSELAMVSADEVWDTLNPLIQAATINKRARHHAEREAEFAAMTKK